jgi:hypothetical protein
LKAHSVKKLKIQADFSFGLFGPKGAVEPELLGCPRELCGRFHSWLRRYREHDQVPRRYDRRSYNEEGRLLAREIQRALAGRYAVTYRYLLPSHDSTGEFEYAAEDMS